jgi:DUF4097 and DUF4098 domain-containing protein YvlB
MRHPRIFFPALLGALLLPAALAAQSMRQRVDTSFAFERGGFVHLNLVSGEIRVTTGTTNEIRIVASTERGRLETSFSRSRVSIEARSVNGRLGSTRYEVVVPAGTRIEAGAVSGDISIRGTGSEVEANSVSGDVSVEDATSIVDVGSVSGDVSLRRVSGRIEANSVSGEVDIDDITGEFDTETVSGTITIRRGKLRSMRSQTVSGDLTYEGTIDPAGDYRFNTHSGDVTITVPANGGAALDLETWSGNISSDFPLTLQPSDNMGGRRNRRMQFNIGTGGARISAETFSGDINIRRAAPRGTEN